MFRIEINPHVTPSQQQPPPPPLYACLNTPSPTKPDSGEKGTIIATIGRKNCDITLESDKSVSRQHCLLRIVSSSGDISEEERQACDDADNGIILVLEDLGSKFGTFVYTEEEKTSEDKEDDETDDGDNGGNEDAEITASSSSEKIKTKKKLDSNSSRILPIVSHPDGEEIVAVGVQGAKLRIRRIPLIFTFSRLPKPVQNKFTRKQMHNLGATTSPIWDPEKCTHLICAQRVSTAKNLSAWVCYKPMVKPEFLLELMGRSSPKDPFPEEKDYIPPGTVPMDALDPNLDRKILKHYLIFSLQCDEMEYLARSAGADIVSLYDIPDDQFFESNFQVDASNEQPMVWIDSTSRKFKKRRDFLLTLDHMFCTNGQEIAKAISQLQPLRDVHDQVIPISLGQGEQNASGSAHDDKDNDDSDAIQSQNPEDVTMDETSCSIQPNVTADNQTNNVAAKDDGGEDKGALENPSLNVDEVSTQPEKPPSTTTRTQPVPSPNNRAISSSQANRTESKKMVKSDANTSTPKRKPLQKTKDGWYMTSPKTSNSSHQFKPEEQQEQEPACTEYADLIITRPKSQQQPSNKSSTNQRKNFKRFRKNVVLCTQEQDLPLIRLQSVLPKESLRQRQLETSQKEIDRREAQAESLFYDHSGGIKQYFQKRKRR